MKLVSAKPEDASLLTEISKTSKRHWDYPEEWIVLWQDELKITPETIEENYVFKLVDMEDEAVGFIVIEESDAHYEVAHLWLLPEHIGKGFGKMMLEDSLIKVVPRGAEIKVIADPYSMPFYSKQGFVKVDEIESLPKGRLLPVMSRKYY
jgi:GNAT superfamily N-acetyltransferase